MCIAPKPKTAEDIIAEEKCPLFCFNIFIIEHYTHNLSYSELLSYFNKNCLGELGCVTLCGTALEYI